MPRRSIDTTALSEDGIPKGEIIPEDSASNQFCPSISGHNVPEDCEPLSQVRHRLPGTKRPGDSQEKLKQNELEGAKGDGLVVVGTVVGLLLLLGVAFLGFQSLELGKKSEKEEELPTSGEQGKRALKRSNDLDLDLDLNDEDMEQYLTRLLELVGNNEEYIRKSKLL